MAAVLKTVHATVAADGTVILDEPVAGPTMAVLTFLVDEWMGAWNHSLAREFQNQALRHDRRGAQRTTLAEPFFALAALRPCQ